LTKRRRRRSKIQKHMEHKKNQWYHIPLVDSLALLIRVITYLNRGKYPDGIAGKANKMLHLNPMNPLHSVFLEASCQASRNRPLTNSNSDVDGISSPAK
jgi:hypothetical protein